MQRVATAVVAVAVCAAALVIGSSAHGHDGDIRWRTLTTTHAQIHYPKTHTAFARHVADVFEDGWRTLTPVFNYRPATPVHVTIDDYSDAANGFANVRPYDRVHIRAYRPRWLDDMAGHGDWVRLLVFHELAHVLHMADHGGVARIVNAILGRSYLPNQYWPRLFLEGLAVWAETHRLGFDRAGTGRIDSPQFMMKLRAAVLDGTVPKLSELTGRPLDWPRGNSWYLWGSVLFDYQVRHFGTDKLKQLLKAYGERPIPFAVNALYRRVYGISAQAMWDRAIEELRRRVHIESHWRDRAKVPPRSAAEVIKQAAPDGPPVAGLPGEGTRVTRDGETKGRIRMHPDGRHATYVQIPNNGLSRVVVLDLVSGNKSDVFVCELGCREPFFSADGQTLHWLEARPYQRVYGFQDAFSMPLDARMRPRGPAKRHSVGQRLRRFGPTSELTGHDPKHPAPAPSTKGLDPQHGADLVDRGAFRDLVRNGLVIARSTRGIRSFSITPDGRRAALVIPHGKGDEVHVLDVPAGSGLVAASTIERPTYLPPKTEVTETEYSSFASVLPRAWRPIVAASADGGIEGVTLGLRTGGRDALRLHTWDLTMQSDVALRLPMISASWTWQRYEPTWTAAATYLHSTAWFTRGYRLYRVADRRAIAQLGGSWRYPVLRDVLDFSANVRAAVTTLSDDIDRFRRQLDQHDPHGPAPHEPFEGRTTTVSAGVSWSRQEMYLNSVVPERLRSHSLFVSYGSRYLLSERPRLRVDMHANHMWPLGKHRVLQWRARVGLGQVFEDEAAPYSIHGLPLFNPQSLLFGGAGSDFSVVRGFIQPVGAKARSLRGHGMGWTSLQVHWPLFNHGAGLELLPVFLARSWLVVFVDAAGFVDRGETTRRQQSGTGWVGSAGLEIRTGLEAGYRSQGNIVIGYARAFGDVASSQWYLRLAP